jgi:type I restriction enzyme, S subunit
MSGFMRLGDQSTKIGSGQTPAGGYRSYVPNGIPLIRSQNVLMGDFSSKGLAYISKDIDDSMAGSRVLPGDVLLNITGASIGRVCVVPDEICPANVNQHVCIIRCADSLNPDFVAIMLASPKFQAFIWDIQAGGTRQALTKQMIENFEIPWHKVEKQRQIAARLKAQLAEVETARQAAQAQLNDTRLLRSRMLKAFFAELDTAPKKKLGDYAKTTSGSTPSRSNKAYWQPAEVAWVKTGEVAFAPITATEEAISTSALAECSLTVLPPKTILIAMYGQGKTRGQSAILEIPATTNQACFAILPNDTWEPDFLYLWLKSSYQDLRDLSDDRGGNQANLNGALLKALDVPAPSRPEQQQMVARIQAAMTEIDALENSSKAALKDINLLPSRILAQAFDQ